MSGEPDPMNAYTALVQPADDARWAFGGALDVGRWDDPLAGLDPTVPVGVDAAALAAYCLGLGDDALVLAQRLNQWCTRAPELEEEVALANVALDLLGQTRFLYARAAAADPGCVPGLPEGSPAPDEDRLAFFRGPAELRCVRLVEPPDADFAAVVVRLVVFAVWRVVLFEALAASADPVLAAVAAKGAKELRYHVDYAARWVDTLAGGTGESRRRTEQAVSAVWPYTAQLGRTDALTERLVSANAVPEPGAVADQALGALRALFAEAGLEAPAPAGLTAGRDEHTPQLAALLEQMQALARAHPTARW